MNREIAKKVLGICKQKPIQISNDKFIVFARQKMEDIEEIEKYTNEQLINEWKSLVYMNYIYGMVSVSELQRIDLIQLEIEERNNIDIEELNKWFEKTKKEFNRKQNEMEE